MDSRIEATFEERELSARKSLGTEACAWIDEALRCFLIEPGDCSAKDRAEFWEIMLAVQRNSPETDRLTAENAGLRHGISVRDAVDDERMREIERLRERGDWLEAILKEAGIKVKAL